LQFDKDIIGEWKFAMKESTRKFMHNKKSPQITFGDIISGYIFFEDKSCENKLGYYNLIESIEREDRKVIYLGNKTKYKIENDSLKIFDLSKKTWTNQKIVSISKDTLVIQESDSIYSKYSKSNYKLNPTETYDRILVSSTGCFGTCPMMNISIEKNGNIFYFGERYNTSNGIFTSKITIENYQEIEATFKKANIPKIENAYSANWTDDEQISISFIKDNKILKTITDYGRQAPIELIWAYSQVRSLYQQIKLTPFISRKSKWPLWSEISFKTKNQICHIEKSEAFYLWLEIIKGQEVKQKFEEKYEIESLNGNEENLVMVSDGQFYKYTNASGSKTIDIGYNFLKENNLIRKFRNKIKYE